MKESFKRSWRKVPLFCVAAGLISFYSKIYTGSNFFVPKLLKAPSLRRKNK